MEFEALISSLDREGLARAAETLLRALSGGGAIPSLPDPAPGREARAEGAIPPSAPGTGGTTPLSAQRMSGPIPLSAQRMSGPISLSAQGAARPLPGAESAGQDGPAAAETPPLAPAAVPGGAAAGEAERIAERRGPLPGAEALAQAAEITKRLDPGPGQSRRDPDPAAEELARIGERLAAVSERKRRGLGAGTESAPPYLSPDGSAARPGPGAAGPRQFSALSAPRAAASGADAGMRDADTRLTIAGGGAAERSFLDAEAVSEFFRRDSRRYDSGFSD